MKKLYGLLMTMIGVALFNAQTVYSENMGTPTATTLITSYSGWQNAASTGIAYSGSGDVRTSSPSTTTAYSAASGGGNVFLTSTAGKNLIISGINTSAYSSADLKLYFGYLTNSTATQMVVEVSTNGTTWTPLTFTNNANTSWNYVTIGGGQIPSSTTLSLRFTQPATAQMRIDDVKIANVSSTCALVPGSPTTACDASTLAIDKYTISIPYTGGGTATYTITPTTGTVGGDNPSTVASGTILITGTNEGVDNSITITGGTCNFTIPISAPVNGCKPINSLPLNEPFNYTVGSALTAQQTWSNLNSGDNILVSSGNLSYSGIASSGNSVSFAGAGAEARTPFTTTTSGTVYASFLFSVSDLSAVTDLSSTYFALFTDDVAGSTNARLWIKKSGTQYQFGLGAGSSADTWSTNLYDPTTTTQYLILAYDFSANTLSLFENQSSTSKAPSVTVTLTTPLTNVGGFMLRQDAATTTPGIIFDELKVQTTAPTLSVSDIVKSKNILLANTLVANSLNFQTKGNASVKVYNANGQMVKTAIVSPANSTVDVSTLEKGVYIVTAELNGEKVSQKIIKK